jgi:hypothetical protein
MSAKKIRAGHYYAAKHIDGPDDIIVGRITSVRSNGEVIYLDLLSGKPLAMKLKVLIECGHRISKAQVDDLLAVWKKTTDPLEVRRKATALFVKQLELPTRPILTAQEALGFIHLSDDASRQARIRELLKRFEEDLFKVLKRD